ncbi:28530_t:CDS:2, partial [Racocetra persica]
EGVRDELLALPRVAPIAHLIDVVGVHLSLNELKHKFTNILRVSKEHNPVFVGVYIDIERNNVVITLYDELNGHNAEYIVDVRRFNPIFDRQNLHNHHQNLHNERSNSHIIKRQPPLIHSLLVAGDGLLNLNNLNRHFTCSLGFLARTRPTNEDVFVTSGLCFRPNQNYHLLPWTSHVEHDVIGRMTRMGRLTRELDFGILSIDNPIYIPMPSIRHTESIYNAQLPIRGGPVFTYLMNVNDGDLRTSRANLKGIITGGVGNFAFVTKLERIRAEANLSIVTSLVKVSIAKFFQILQCKFLNLHQYMKHGCNL